VTHVAAEVDAEPALAGGEELAEGLELVPGDGRHGHGVHVLDLGEDAGHELAVAGLARGEREAAVAGQHRGHAVVAGDRGVGVEGDLRVVVGVGVDDAGGHDGTFGVDLVGGRAPVEVGELGDAPVPHADVDPPARQAGAVDHIPVADDEVELGPLAHLAASPCAARVLGRRYRRIREASKRLV
jgi:hypothetical protein